MSKVRFDCVQITSQWFIVKTLKYFLKKNLKCLHLKSVNILATEKCPEIKWSVCETMQQSPPDDEQVGRILFDYHTRHNSEECPL